MIANKRGLDFGKHRTCRFFPNHDAFQSAIPRGQCGLFSRFGAPDPLVSEVLERKMDVLTKISERSDVAVLVSSLSGLIDTMVQIFPEGVDESFDADMFLVILAKAEQEVRALTAALSTPDMR